MLRHSTKLLVSNQRSLHLSRILNQVEVKAVNDEKGKSVPVKQVNIQEKIRNASNTALTRYNEIIGFSEIDAAYQKVTALQVKNMKV